jgi:hypothetical protein
MHGRLKGQFFLLGSLLLCGLFFAALPPGPYHSSPGPGLDRDYGNLEIELPRAFNLDVADGGFPSGLAGFLDFAQDSMAARGIAMDALWVAAIPDLDDPGTVQLYAGNWLGHPADVTFTLDGEELSLSTADGEMASGSLSGISAYPELSVSFEGRLWQGGIARDKANLYAWTSLESGEDAAVNEFLA